MIDTNFLSLDDNNYQTKLKIQPTKILITNKKTFVKFSLDTVCITGMNFEYRHRRTHSIEFLVLFGNV